MPAEPRILLGVSGSIAAYKAVDLVRRLQRRGAAVSVVMTRTATDYVGPLTFEALTGRPVACGGFRRARGRFPHLDLAGEADLILVAPCTANLLAKIAHGFADDLLTAAILARETPLILAPAMNARMWTNPATQENLAVLRRRDIDIVEAEAGELACGETGPGRLASPERILEAVDRRLSPPDPARSAPAP